MKRFFSLAILVGLLATLTATAQEIPIQYTFSGATAEENAVTLQSAGFGAYPQAGVSFGNLPTDNSFDGATDGYGAIVTAQPGEGVMIFAQPIVSQNAAVIRCAVRTDSAHAQVTLAAIGGQPDTFVSTNSPFNQAYFQGQYQRLSAFVTPPAGGFTPVLQILNTSATEPLTAYADNLEIRAIERFYGYHGEYLNGDKTDPAADTIQKEATGNESGILGWDKRSTRQSPSDEPLGVSVDNFIRLDFAGKTMEANSVSLQGAGFGSYPQASVSFTYIPTDNAFEGATDGQGAYIEAKPGEGVMIFGPSLTNNESAMIRCNVRTESDNASITIAAIGAEPDRFISTNTTNNPGYFMGQYKRISTFVTPPSGGFQPVIQIVNTSETETLYAYLDEFDTVVLNPTYYYYGEFLNGDETDPGNGQIGFPANDSSSAFPPTPTPIPQINVTLASNVNMGMQLIPAGSFSMGSPSTEIDRKDNEGPAHKVTITKSFYIGITEVTQKQWVALMGNNPSYTGMQGDSLPVNNISWNECQSFIAKLNALNIGVFRLPTEAEWEYACRAGTTTRFYWGNDLDFSKIDSYCTCYNPPNQFTAPRPVGSYHLNNVAMSGLRWVLDDMSGNVWEYCSDWFGNYSSTDQTDPTGPSTGTTKVMRGGSFFNINHNCRSACRTYQDPDTFVYWNGLRVVREL